MLTVRRRRSRESRRALGVAFFNAASAQARWPTWPEPPSPAARQVRKPLAAEGCDVGALWGINSLDQCGVEIGKVLAKDIEPRLASGLDAPTAGLLSRIRINS
jgi:Phosphoglucose isomerase